MTENTASAESISSYRELIVWQKAMQVVTEIYSLTSNFPRSEVYCLVSQMRRCAVSIPSNIAEGRRRGSRKDFRNFLTIAFGSGAELETQLEITKRLSFGNDQQRALAENLLEEVMKMLNRMIKSLLATS